MAPTFTHADNRNLINPGLFGGRPGCEAQSLPFLEELKYDICYVTRRTLINFDNDASSCYDRIIISLASLINRKFGLHRRVALVHALTLQQARFHLRTRTGFSDLSYTHSIQFPIYGSGREAVIPQAFGYLYLPHSAMHTWSLLMALASLAQMDVNKSRSQWWDSSMIAQALATTSVRRNKPTLIPS